LCFVEHYLITLPLQPLLPSKEFSFAFIYPRLRGPFHPILNNSPPPPYQWDLPLPPPNKYKKARSPPFILIYTSLNNSGTSSLSRLFLESVSPLPLRSILISIITLSLPYDYILPHLWPIEDFPRGLFLFRE